MATPRLPVRAVVLAGLAGLGGLGGLGGQANNRTAWWIVGVAAVAAVVAVAVGIAAFINRDGDGETTSAAPTPSEVAAGSNQASGVPSGAARRSPAAVSPTSVAPIPDRDDSPRMPDLSDINVPLGSSYVIKIEGVGLASGSWSDNESVGSIGAEPLPWIREGTLPAPLIEGFGGTLGVNASGTDLTCTVEIAGRVVDTSSAGSYVTCNVTWSPA